MAGPVTRISLPAAIGSYAVMALCVLLAVLPFLYMVSLSLQSDAQTLTQLDQYGEDVISPALSTVDGVGEVSVFGQKQYAVRVDANPAALTARGIGLDQLTTAIGSQNSIAPVGTIANPNQQMAIEADTQPQNAAQFSQLIIASPNGKPVRLGDVARVTDSIANTQTGPSLAYDPTLGFAIAIVDKGQDALYFTRSVNDGKTWSEKDPVYQSGSGGWYPSLSINPDSHDPSIAFYICARAGGK